MQAMRYFPLHEYMQMNRNLLSVILLGLACLALPGGMRGAVGKNDPVWLADYQAARQLAQATGKPLFVVFRCVP